MELQDRWKRIRARRWRLMPVLLVGIMLFSPVAGFSDTPGTREVFVIAGDLNYPPYEFIDTDYVYKGFNVDCIRAIADAQGFDVEIIPMTWADAMKALENGDVDAIQGMTKSPERVETYDFSKDLVINSQAIFVKKDQVQIMSLKDLEGKRVAHQRGDVSKSIVQSIRAVEAIDFKDQQAALAYLNQDQADAFIGNRLTGLYVLHEMGYLENIKIVGEAMYEAPYGIAVSKGDSRFLGLLNRGIDKIKSDGTYDRIYKKWFGTTFEDNSGQLRRQLTIAISGIVALVAVIAVGLFWNYALKTKVEQATGAVKRKNELLAKNSREKDLIIESIQSAIVSFDRDRNVTTANGYAKELLGIADPEGYGFHELKLGEHFDGDVFEEVKGGRYHRSRFELRSPRLGVRNIDLSFYPIEGPLEVEGYLLFMHDYTEDKRLQDDLKQKDKLAALGQLSAGIAHELRNPLTGIKAYIDLLPQKIENAEFRENLIRIVPSEITRLDSLVSMLLDYSRPRRIDRKAVSLQKTLQEILPLLSGELSDKQIHLLMPEIDVVLYVDPSHLKQILINILKNGMDAVSVHGQIAISTWDEDGFGHIEIEDNGPGMDSDTLKRIFEPFFSQKVSGTGIGLAVTQQLVLENGGRILAFSEIGKGTRLRLIFDAVEIQGSDFNHKGTYEEETTDCR